MDYQNTLKSLLQSMRQSAADQFCTMLRELADSIEAEQETVESYQDDAPMPEFDMIWDDR